MTRIYPTIRSMSWDEAREFGLVNQGLMMKCDTASYRLSAGRSDQIHTFQSGATILVLTLNYHLSYLALDAYLGSCPDPIDSIFLQGSSIEELLGSNWDSLPLPTLATRLLSLFA